MRKNSIKNTRINGEVQRELANIIRGGIKDPRISPLTSVVAVEVAPDLKTCKAYISVLGDSEAQKATLAGLERGRLYSPGAGPHRQFKKHTGDPLYSGSVHRVRCAYVKDHR